VRLYTVRISNNWAYTSRHLKGGVGGLRLLWA
jgi:hypothetical protein